MAAWYNFAHMKLLQFAIANVIVGVVVLLVQAQGSLRRGTHSGRQHSDAKAR
jgi:hypothetical protein